MQILPSGHSWKNTLRVREGYLLLFIALVTLYLYYPTILAPFCVLDDTVLAQRILNQPSWWSYIKVLFGPKQAGVSGVYFRPLSTLVFYLSSKIFGLEPSPLHLFNVLVHLGSGLLIYLLVRGIYATDTWRTWLAFTAALLFLLNPLNVEAVAWVSGRPCLMATFFILLAFFLHLRVRRDLRDWFLWAAAFCYLLSLLSYEIAAALPLAFIYWDLNQDDNKSWRQTARTYYRRWLPYGLVLAVYVGYRLWRGVSEPGSHAGGGSPMFLNVLDALLHSPSSPFVAVGFYLKKVFWPWPLNLHIEKVARLPYFVVGVIFLLGFTWMLWKRSWPRFWAFWFLCGLLVALLLSFSSFSWTTAAERYVYPSSIAAAVFTSLLVFRVLTSKPRWIAGASKVLLLCLLLSFGSSTVLRAITWQSNLALIEDTLKKSPESGRVTGLYGGMLHDIGRTEEAVVYLKKAIELGYVPPPARRLGDIENSRKNYAAAERYYLQSLWPFQTAGLQDRTGVRNLILGHKRKPDTYFALANLHRKMLAQEPERRAYHEERIIHFHQAASKLKPNNAFLKYELAKAHLHFGHLDEARKLFDRVAEMEPDTYYGKAAAKLAMAEKISKDKETVSFQEFINNLRNDQRGG